MKFFFSLKHQFPPLPYAYINFFFFPIRYSKSLQILKIRPNLSQVASRPIIQFKNSSFSLSFLPKREKIKNFLPSPENQARKYDICITYSATWT